MRNRCPERAMANIMLAEYYRAMGVPARNKLIQSLPVEGTEVTVDRPYLFVRSIFCIVPTRVVHSIRVKEQ